MNHEPHERHEDITTKRMKVTKVTKVDESGFVSFVVGRFSRRPQRGAIYGSAKTYIRGLRSVLISGVIPAAALPTSDVPVLTATYCLPSTEYEIG